VSLLEVPDHLQHYFTAEPLAECKPRTVEATLRGILFRFETDAGVFAKHGIDPGTKLLVEKMTFPPDASVCDLGCGYGVIGVVATRLATRVTLADVNARAVELARKNLRGHGAANAAVLQADGLRAFRQQSFDVIICNPPIRAGNAVVFRLFQESFDALKPGGRFWMIAQTKQGAKSFRKKLAEIFRVVEEPAIKGGYRILVGVK